MTTKENPSMDLDELERLLAEATPGPWETDEIPQAVWPDDAALIVAAVNSLPALIAAARRAEELHDALEEIMELIDRDEETWVVEEYQDIIDRARATLAEGAPR